MTLEHAEELTKRIRENRKGRTDARYFKQEPLSSGGPEPTKKLTEAMDRLAQIFTGASTARGQRAYQGEHGINGLALGFMRSGIAGAAASGLPSLADPMMTGASQATGLAKGGFSAAAMAAGAAFGGVPGFMVGGAVGQLGERLIDAVAGASVRESQSAAEMNKAEYLERMKAGIPTTMADRARISQYNEMQAAAIEKAGQEGVADADRAREATGKAGLWERFVNSIKAGADGFRSSDDVLYAVERSRATRRDSAFGGASGY